MLRVSAPRISTAGPETCDHENSSASTSADIGSSTPASTSRPSSTSICGPITHMSSTHSSEPTHTPCEHAQPSLPGMQPPESSGSGSVSVLGPTLVVPSLVLGSELVCSSPSSVQPARVPIESTPSEIESHARVQAMKGG